MSDDILAQIITVFQAHSRRVDYNHPGYGNCHCGFVPDSDHPQHVAEALLAALQKNGLYIVGTGVKTRPFPPGDSEGP